MSLDKPNESNLLKAINYKDDLEMPPTGKLTSKDIDILTRWVKMGAPFPAGTVATKEAKTESKASADALGGISFDRRGLGARGLRYEKLDQLTMEVLLGVR